MRSQLFIPIQELKVIFNSIIRLSVQKDLINLVYLTLKGKGSGNYETLARDSVVFDPLDLKLKSL